MLELGLKRISRLVDATKLPWKAIHVAGTNGKGSVCAAIDTVLNGSRISTGTFTSPHFIDRWDGISINGSPIEEDNFLDIEKQVKDKDERLKLGATEFELLTATAFEAFNRAKVEVGVVEVGVGGTLDATNILQNPIATVITRIAEDHEALLGKGILNIAKQKAGIMKPGAPCFIDGSNTSKVKELLANHAEESGVSFFKSVSPLRGYHFGSSGKDLEIWQRSNLTLAYEACRVVLGVAFEKADRRTTEMFRLLSRSSLPGRKQFLDLGRVTGRKQIALLDGSHNRQSLAGLETYVNHRVRGGKLGSVKALITWVLAFTDGKDMDEMLLRFVKRRDIVIAVEFGPVSGMPWIKPRSATEIVELAQKVRSLREAHVADSVEQALHFAARVNPENPIVIAGSLYLMSDVLRLLRNKGASRKELGMERPQFPLTQRV
ncbi:folylpolyglutamate synthase [Thelotrema lepadinum]|nr:folylpolyglutamate synthase [Thelotrema lepadinum]